jgi:site-specific DNA-methyltransferase (adenine-specific)
MKHTFNLNHQLIDIRFGDCIEEMSKIPLCSIDLIIADPPYKLEMPETTGVDNLLKKKKIKLVNENWDKFSLNGYVDFTSDWIEAAMPLLKPHGSIFIFGSYHNIGLVNYVLQSKKIMIINDIAWFKRNAVPNLACRRLTASYENILWAAKTKKYNFNYEVMKDYPNDVIHKRGKQMRNVWDIPTNSAESVAHPTQKPVALYKRIIDVACVEGGMVLDPFGGSGTLAIAASAKGRDSILIERDPKYFQVIQDRVQIAVEKAKPIMIGDFDALPTAVAGSDEPNHSRGA